MAGRTISFHASEELAGRLEHAARVEDRSPSQIASAALDLYLRLPPEAHSALRHVHALGTDEDRHQAIRSVARVLINAQYDLAVRQMGIELRERGIAVPDSEEELLAEAVRMTSRPKPPVPRSAGERQPRTRPRTRKTR
jgi:hypothetical protein